MYRIGIDLGGTNIAVGVVDDGHAIVSRVSVPTMASRPAAEVVRDMGGAVEQVLARAGVSVADCRSMGVGSPGTCNSADGVVERAYNLGWDHVPVCRMLEQRFGIPCRLSNDANCAALAEQVAGAAVGHDNVVLVTLGTGVGGGIIIDNKVYSGFNHAGAELGHVVIELNGKPCSCGRKGCWEAYSSATGLINMTKDKLAATKDTVMHEMVEKDGKVSGRTAFDAMRKGDKAAKEVVDEYIYDLAMGITNIINIFQPEVLVIGGGICNEKNYLLDPLNAIVNSEQYTRNNKVKTELRIAKLGNDAGIIGAAMLGL